MHMDAAVLLPNLFPYEEDERRQSTTTIEHHYDSPEFPDTIEVTFAEPKQMPFIDATAYGAPKYVQSFEDYVGQEPLKAELNVYIDEALVTCQPLPHILLASGMPGVGKTTLAELMAQEMGVRYVKLVPPFSPQALYDAAKSMRYAEILFIDEIHKLADNGPRMAENLLHMMEEGVLYLEDGVHVLEQFTIIGATTDADKLPETIIDRFMVKPYFQPYSIEELERITRNFARFFEFEITDEITATIARACRSTPRIARELVIGARALTRSLGRDCEPEELLSFKQVEPDGTTRQHKAYLKAMLQFFGREDKDGNTEYIAGEASMMSLLRENKVGIARLERFLIERGLVDRTPRGRRLTDRGIAAAQEYLATETRLGSE